MFFFVFFLIPYSGRLSWKKKKNCVNWWNKGKNFRGLLADGTKRCHAQNFTEKSFVNSHKSAKSSKVFFLESFLLYGMFLI